MILNDAFDADDDAIDRPERPIPAGLISLRASFTVGFGFLMLAMAIPLIYLLEQTQRTTCIGWPGFHQEDIWRLAVIWLLAGTILLYDGLLKKTFVAPALMGCCRTLNILLGGAAIFVSWAGGLHTRLIWYAISVGIFVAGITLLARSEAKTTVTRFSLARAALVLVAGLAMIVVSPLIDENSAHLNSASAIGGQFYYILIAVITLPIILRLYYAVHQCTPKAIGNAIVTSLTSLIFFDAAFCLLARPDQPFYAGLVASLVVPVFFLRRLSAQT